MARKLEDAITADEKQRQIQIAYDMYVGVRKLIVPPDRGVFAMGFMMGMRRGFALATDTETAIEHTLMKGLSDG